MESHEARSCGDSGSSSPVPERFDVEVPEQGEDTKDADRPQPEAKPESAGLHPPKKILRGTGRKFGKWRRLVCSILSQEPSPSSLPPDISVAPPMVNGCVFIATRSPNDSEERDLVDSKIVDQRR